MRKIVLLVGFFVFFAPPVFGEAIADESAENSDENSNQIKCDQIIEIINSGNCKNWVVEPSVGIWCNLITSREMMTRYKYYAPTYVFALGEVCPDSTLWGGPSAQASSEDEGTKSDQPQADKQGSEQERLLKLNVFLDSTEALMKHNVTLELTNPEDLKEFLAGGGPFTGARTGWVRELGIDIESVLGREPTITPKDEDNAWAFTPEYKDIPDEENIAVVKGFDKFTVINDKFVAVDTVFTGPTSGMVELKYVWEVNSGAVINVSPKTEIKFEKPVQDKKTQDLKRMVKLNRGELEVKVKNANSKNKFGIQTDFLDLYVIGTHFWVSHDRDKNYTLVGVYDGEVEIQTKDGKTTTITPNGGRPSIFIITQEFSAIKLALCGLVAIAVIFGAVFLLKRRRGK